MRYFIGLDVHWRHTNVCILKADGTVFRQLRLQGDWEQIPRLLAELEGPLAVCFEASCGYGYLYELLSRVAARVVVAHPGQLRLIFRSKRKHDRVDARKLAQLLLVDFVPSVYVPQRCVRAWRQTIEFRQALVAKRTRVKNALRSLLRSVGVRAPVRPGLWSRAGQRWLRGIEFSEPLQALQRDLLCQELDHLTQQLARVESQLEIFSKDHPSIFLLRTIPGIGLRTAEALVAYIDDPRRFRRNKSIGCYFGLVPSQDQSGERNRLGHITGEGPASVRRLLSEAAWQGIRRSPTIAAYFHRVRGDDPDRKKIALVATAHYLARVTLAMLRTGELWREGRAA